MSPTAFALIVERYDYVAAEWMMCGAGLISLLGMELLAAWYRRRRRR